MEYKKINQVIVARIDKGEEILTEIEHIAKLEKIKLANINALGAVLETLLSEFLKPKRNNMIPILFKEIMKSSL